MKVELYDRLMKAADAAHWGKCPGASETLKREASAVFTDLHSRHVIPPYPELEWRGLIRVGVLRNEAVSLMLDCATRARQLGWRDLEERIVDLIEPDESPVRARSAPSVVDKKEEEHSPSSLKEIPLPKEGSSFLGGITRGIQACFSACGRAFRGVTQWAFGQ